MKFGRVLLALATLVLCSAALPTSGHAITYYFTETGSENFGDLAAPGYGSVSVTTFGSDLKFELNLAPNWFVDTGNDNKPLSSCFQPGNQWACDQWIVGRGYTARFSFHRAQRWRIHKSGFQRSVQLRH